MSSKNITSCSLKKTTGSMEGSAPLGVEFSCPRSDETQVELGFQVAIEVARWDQLLQRDSDRLVEAAGLGWTEHGVLPDAVG
jgi:hypothetical protein